MKKSKNEEKKDYIEENKNEKNDKVIKEEIFIDNNKKIENDKKIKNSITGEDWHDRDKRERLEIIKTTKEIEENEIKEENEKSQEKEFIKEKKDELDDNDEEDEKDDSEINSDGINKNKKCSLNKHKDYNAVTYCQECDKYMCKKCEEFHSQLFEDHNLYNIDKNIKGIFTGICKEKNHNDKLSYFCETHNQLCCAACISKIKGIGNGKHKDCNISSIKNIKSEKKRKLKENMNYLNDIYKNLDKINNTKEKISKKIEEFKEKIKINIKEIFTNILNILKKREDELLLKVDKIYSDLLNKEEFLKKIDEMPNIIKISLDKGKIEENDWKNKNKLSLLINNCIEIENNIKEINKLNQNIKELNFVKKYEIKFTPQEEIDKFINNIKNFGDIVYKEK